MVVAPAGRAVERAPGVGVASVRQIGNVLQYGCTQLALARPRKLELVVPTVQ